MPMERLGGSMRISRDSMLLGMASMVAQRGTCPKLQVGAVFSRDGRVISQGYNGTPAGIAHCNHKLLTADEPWPEYFNSDDTIRLPHSRLAIDESGSRTQYTVIFPGNDPPSCPYAEHAETNGILFAARHGVELLGSELHVTHMPCYRCAMGIISSGVIRVVFSTPYRLTDGVELLEEAGIAVIDASRW